MMFLATILAVTAVATAAPAAKGPCACGVAPERANDFYWENDKVGFRAYGPGDYHLWSGIDVFNKGHDGVEVESLLRRNVKGCFGNWHNLAALKGGLRTFDNYAVGAGRGVGGIAFLGDDEWKTYPNWETCEVHAADGDEISFTLVYPAFSAAGKMTCRVTMRTGEPFFRNEVTFEKDEFAAMGFRAGPGLDVSAARGHDGDLFESKELGVVSLFENPKKDAKGNDEGSTMTAVFVEDPSAVEFLTDHMGCRVLAFKKRSFVYWAGASWSGRGEFTTPRAWHDYVRAFQKSRSAAFMQEKSQTSDMLPATARPEIAAAVERGAQKPHPRLFADAAAFAALRERVKTDELVRLGAECVRGRADVFLTKKPSERKLIGTRLLVVSRETLHRVTTLAMAYRLFGDRRYLDRAVAELRAVCAFPDWNPSHFLDVAEMSLAVATGYDWLYDDLDEATRREIAAALRKHGLDASRQAKWWITTGNNWNQVCHAGILAAALALAEEDPPETARFVQRAIDCLPIAMASYAPNGNFPEGPGYWIYATDFNVLAIRLLEGVLGSDFGLLSLPGFRETARYQDYVTGPSGRFFNYADGGDRRGSVMSLWWFARRFEYPEILPYFEIAAYRRFCKTWRGAEERAFAYELLDVRTPPAEVETDLPRVWNGSGTSPVAVMRSSWDDKKAMFVGLKGGSPKVNHGHMDVGSFVLDTKGVRWAIDLGPEDYTKIEQRGMSLWNMKQTSDRWKVYRLNAWSHNELVLDGCQQNVDGFGTVVEAREIEGGAALRATLDLTTVYTNATKVVRQGTLASDGTRFELRDVVRGLRPGAPIRWAMATRAKVEPQTDGSLLLREGGQALRLAQTGALTGAWRVAPAKGPNEWDTENKGVTQITFEVAMPSEGDAHLAVMFSR